MLDSLRQPRGHWEAKDLRDNLDSEIQRKFNGGYPRYNIVFEDSQTAVLYQNREETMRADMSRPADLHRLINRFLDYERPEIQEFHRAQEQFKADLPGVIGSLRESVEAAEAGNPDYRAAAANFLTVCQLSISPAVTGDDVREMLLQHILTQDIFSGGQRTQFRLHSDNNIARRLSNLERTFFTDEAHLQALARLQSYYGAIGRAADEITDYAEKQKFLKAIYEDFYKAYTRPPPTASASSTPPTRLWTSSFAAPITCCKSTSARAWPTTTCRFSTPPPAPAPSSPASSTTCPRSG